MVTATLNLYALPAIYPDHTVPPAYIRYPPLPALYASHPILLSVATVVNVKAATSIKHPHKHA